jgi:hypothetical protein
MEFVLKSIRLSFSAATSDSRVTIRLRRRATLSLRTKRANLSLSTEIE